MEDNWLKNAKIYQILIDRFSGCTTSENSLEFLGGNLRGITEKLDYIKSLGINTIWLSPFYESVQYHGYHIKDFKKVDPHFGTVDDLQKLISTAHEKSLKVIADIVPNHCSVLNPLFLQAHKKKASNLENWFYFNKWPDDYLCFLDVWELPKINLENPQTRNYFIDIAKYWLSLGLDGFRIDHIIGPSHDFSKVFYREIKKEFPRSILIGEAWGMGLKSKHFKTVNFKNKLIRRIFGISQENLQKEYYHEIDGILDFYLNFLIRNAIIKGRGFSSDKIFLMKVRKHLNEYPSDYLPVIFLDNHDMDRFLRNCNGDENIMIEAIEFLSELKLPMVLYYGTENGMINTVSVLNGEEHADLAVREPFDWNNINIELYNRIGNILKRK